MICEGKLLLEIRKKLKPEHGCRFLLTKLTQKSEVGKNK